MSTRLVPLNLLAACVLGFFLSCESAVWAADHDDTPALKTTGRHDARISDLHVFTRVHASPGNGKHRRTSLALAVSTNPTIPTTAATYVFPSDLTLELLLDRHSEVDFTANPDATATFGGAIVDPSRIHADVALTITFDASGTPRLATAGIDADTPITLFAGMRDDPFIRGPRQGRNVASVVIELPLRTVTRGRKHGTLLVWAVSSVPGPERPIGDLGARALRSQFAENSALNDYPDPAAHTSVLGVRPDVVIFDATRPAAFPNGRELTDDVVDLVGDTRILMTDCPVPGDPLRCSPATNDVPFLTTFPYLAPPQGATQGEPGVILRFGDGGW